MNEQERREIQAIIDGQLQPVADHAQERAGNPPVMRNRYTSSLTVGAIKRLKVLLTLSAHDAPPGDGDPAAGDAMRDKLG